MTRTAWHEVSCGMVRHKKKQNKKKSTSDEKRRRRFHSSTQDERRSCCHTGERRTPPRGGRAHERVSLIDASTKHNPSLVLCHRGSIVHQIRTTVFIVVLDGARLNQLAHDSNSYRTLSHTADIAGSIVQSCGLLGEGRYSMLS